MTIVSKRLFIKENVLRSVHVNTNNNRGRWVISHDGKFICITGSVETSHFVVDEKYKYIVNNYLPKRNSNKIDDCPIKITKAKRKQKRVYYGREIFEYLNEKRILTYTNKNRTSGFISWKGKRLYIKL